MSCDYPLIVYDFSAALGTRVFSNELVGVWCRKGYFKPTFVANATVVVRPFTVFLEVICHISSSQKLATNFAGDFVLMACKV